MIKINKKNSFIVLGIIFISVFVLLTNRLPNIKKPISTAPLFPTDTISGKEILPPVKSNVSKLSEKISDSISQTEKDKLAPLLPINIKNFSTSVKIPTNINIFSVSSEPSQVIHLEIYGINYNFPDPTLDNPHAVAFLESFTHVKKLLFEKGINLNNLQILYGNRNYIQTTAEGWIKTFKLLP